MPDLREQLRKYGSFLDESARGTSTVGAQSAGATETLIQPWIVGDRHVERDPDVRKRMGSDTMVVDFGAAQPGRTGDHRWLIAAAAVLLAVVVVAGTVLVNESRGHRAPSVRSGTVPPPEGATPSTPETGELVAAIAFGGLGADPRRGTSINVYADGRIVRLAPDAPGGMAEQRLSAEGVEAVRSALLSTGLFDTGQTNSDVDLWCACHIRVRDDGGRLVVPAFRYPRPSDPARAMVDPRVKGEVDHLVELMTHLESSLPASAWAEREVRAYVPSRYQFGVWEDPSNVSADENQRAVRDLSAVLTQLLPRRLVRRLDRQGWRHTPWDDSIEVTTADARAIDEALTDAGLRRNPWQGSIGYQRGSLVYPRRPHISLGLTPFLPDGLPYGVPG
jgi:hypothetical protein